MSKKNKAEETKAENKVYVYIGPSIKGVIQNGTIYSCQKETILSTLNEAIITYPSIELLLIPAEELPEANKRIKLKGDPLNYAFSEIKKGGIIHNA